MTTTSFPKRARRRLRERNRPKPGWQYGYCTDLRKEGDYPGTCEHCGRSGIRFLHTLEHERTGETKEVGCNCAGKLVAGLDAKAIVRRLESLWKKREKFPRRKSWKVSRNGNPYLSTSDYTVTIFSDNYDPDAFAFCVLDKDDGEKYFDSNFLSKEDAMLAAFDCLAELKGWTEP